MITRELREHGSNRSLFGEDRYGRPYRARRVREEESNLGVRGHEDEYARAADDAPPSRLRPRVVKHVQNAIVEADKDGHPIARDLEDLLAKHQQQRQAAESREIKRYKTLGKRIQKSSGVERYVALEEWCELLKR
jgi:hypothetical protein